MPGPLVDVQGSSEAVRTQMAQITGGRGGVPIERARVPRPHRVVQRPGQMLCEGAPLYPLQTWCVLSCARRPSRAWRSPLRLCCTPTAVEGVAPLRSRAGSGDNLPRAAVRSSGMGRKRAGGAGPSGGHLIDHQGRGDLATPEGRAPHGMPASWMPTARARSLPQRTRAACT